jgi:hypothetical protein
LIDGDASEAAPTPPSQEDDDRDSALLGWGVLGAGIALIGSGAQGASGGAPLLPPLQGGGLDPQPPVLPRPPSPFPPATDEPHAEEPSIPSVEPAPATPPDLATPSDSADPAGPTPPANPANPANPAGPADPADPPTSAEPPAPDRPAIPVPPPPSLALARDTGLSASDRLTCDATVAVTGLAEAATWAYSLDDGLTWRTGQDAAIAASAFAEGRTSLLVRQTTAGGTGEAARLDFTLRSRGETFDLSPTEGLQEALNLTVDPAAMASGVALTAMPLAAIAHDIQELRLRLGGDGLAPANDRLQLDRGLALALDKDAQAHDIRIGGLDHLFYRYDSATQALSIWRADDTALTGSDAAALTNAIRLVDTQGLPRAGKLELRIGTLDLAGNVSDDSVIALTVDPRAPLLDFNGASKGVDLALVTGSMAAPTGLLSSGGRLTHANPDATFKQLRIDLGGPALGAEDLLISSDGGRSTTLADGSTAFHVAGIAWRATRVADHVELQRADGTPASLAQTEAVLASLALQNTQAAPMEGSRRLAVTVVDHLDRSASAALTLRVDHTGPEVDLNGPLPGLDQPVAVTPGLIFAFHIDNVARGVVRDDSLITSFQVVLNSPVPGAFDSSDPRHQEWFGFYRPSEPTIFYNMFRLGERGVDMEAYSIFKGQSFTVTFRGGPGKPQTIRYEPHVPITPEQAHELLDGLYYTCGADTAPGLRTMEITATDIVGNTSAVVARTLIDVRAPDTPVVRLATGCDTGARQDDGITSVDGGSASPLALAGFAKAGSTVSVFHDLDGDGVAGAGEAVGSAVADSNGRWTLTLAGGPLADGVHHFGATADGLSAAILALTVDTQAPATTPVFGSHVNPRPVLSGVTDPGMAVTVKLNADGVFDKGHDAQYLVRADDTGRWILDTSTATPDGGTAWLFNGGDQVHVQVSARDLAGNIGVSTASAVVEATTYAISDSRDTSVSDGAPGARELVFTVMRGGNLSEAGSVRYAVDRDASTAGSGDDALAAGFAVTGASTGEIAFAPGESSRALRFAVLGSPDGGAEAKFVVRLEDPARGVIEDGLGIGLLHLETDLAPLAIALVPAPAGFPAFGGAVI